MRIGGLQDAMSRAIDGGDSKNNSSQKDNSNTSSSRKTRNATPAASYQERALNQNRIVHVRPSPESSGWRSKQGGAGGPGPVRPIHFTLDNADAILPTR